MQGNGSKNLLLGLKQDRNPVRGRKAAIKASTSGGFLSTLPGTWGDLPRLYKQRVRLLQNDKSMQMKVTLFRNSIIKDMKDSQCRSGLQCFDN